MVHSRTYKLWSSEVITTHLVTDKLRISLSTDILESFFGRIFKPQDQRTIFSSIVRCNTKTLTQLSNLQ